MSHKSLLRVALVAGALAVMIGCGKKRSSPGSAGVVSVHAMRPMANPNVAAIFGQHYTTPDDSTVIPEVLEIAGFHDAQRLQKNPAGKEYGPLVKLYAGPRERPQADFLIANGVLVAVMEVYGKTDNWQSYRRLNIENGDMSTKLFCVFLWNRFPAAANGWEAQVRPVVSSGCDGRNPLYDVEVRRVTDNAQQTADSFPTVARFGDDNSGMPTVGVTCGLAWCELGKNLGGTGDYKAPKTTGKGDAQDRIKAWHDEQAIAEQVSPLPGRPLRRSDTDASITPVRGLKDKKIAAFSTANGTHVATIRLDGVRPAGAKYQAWGLLPNALTDVHIRFHDGVWGAQFVKAGDPTVPGDMWFQVKRTKHTIQPPAVARWLWDENDEGTWIACDQGCCEINQDIASLISPSAHPLSPTPAGRRK